MVSMISCLMLLLVTYAYSAPIEPEYANTTPEYEWTTEKTFVQRGNSYKMDLMMDDESTSTSIMHQERSSAESNSEEVTGQNVTPRTTKYHDSTYPSPTTDEYSLSTEQNVKRGVDDYFFTTMESTTEFNRRAIRPMDNEEVYGSSTHDYNEMNKDVESSSSVDSFARVTGLLKDESSSTTPDYEPTGLTKTVSVIPGKITETKIYVNSPSKTSVMIQPMDENQLSQGSTLLLFLLAAFLFCIFLMASTIAIVKSTLSLKRRSRITEMEADLDRHLLR